MYLRGDFAGPVIRQSISLVGQKCPGQVALSTADVQDCHARFERAERRYNSSRNNEYS